MICGMGKYKIPANWNDFEEIVYRVYVAKYPGSIMHRYGRLGQKQLGIDIYIQNSGTVIQCKDKTIASTSDIDEIVQNVTFTPCNMIIIATTGPRDVNLQNYAMNNFNNKVDIVFWDDIEADIDFYNLAGKIYGITSSGKINPNFFADLTEIVYRLCNENDGYMIEMQLLSYIQDFFIKELLYPNDISLIPYAIELKEIANILSKICSIFSPQYYHLTSGNNKLCFNMSSKNDDVLEQNKKTYNRLVFNLDAIYSDFKEKIN